MKVNSFEDFSGELVLEFMIFELQLQLNIFNLIYNKCINIKKMEFLIKQ